jgi:hypothetical protein
LQGQRAELDRDEDRDVVRMTEEVVVHARDARRARDAPEAEGRQPLDILAEAEPGDEQRVDRRRTDPGDRGEQQIVDVGRLEPGRGQSVADSPFGKVGRERDEEGVGLGERREVGVGVEGPREVPGVDAAGGVQALELLPRSWVTGDQGREHGGDLGLRVRPRRQDRRHRCDARHPRMVSRLG